jgi:tetratricopeptide (TPR) repeat protein
MTYPGNPSLSSDVRQRILDTFEQTLDLAGQGNRQEALLGCDFVLRMDPQFEAARKLQERLRAGSGPVEVGDLREPAAPAPGFDPAEEDDPFASFDGLSLDLPDLGTAGGPDLREGLRAELQRLSDERRFPELTARAQQEGAAVASDPELQRMLAEAQERMEAEPYVRKFAGAARQALDAGKPAEARGYLEKARALDPTHPEIRDVETRLAARPAPAAAAAPAAAPAAAAAAPPPAFSLDEPAFSGPGDSESERRIRELLDEGQATLEAGDPQGAIDAWSRIFLIDIDNQEASRRIEGARRRKAESERQVEEVFHDGLARMEAGDTAGARAAFQKVLALQPGHFAAREHLQQLESGNAPAASAPAGTAVPRLPDLGGAEGPVFQEEILVPPEPSEIPAGSGARMPRRAGAATSSGGGEKRARTLFLAVGGLVLLLVAAVGWFLLQNREQVFPNSQPEEPASDSSAPPADPVERARSLHESGKTAIALSQLRRLPPDHPRYQEAQRLVDEWSGQMAPDGVAAAASAGEDDEGPSPAELELRNDLLYASRLAYERGELVRALARLERADQITRLQGADAQLLHDAQSRLQYLARELDLVRQREWEYALPELWRLRESDPGDPNVNRLLLDAYYNLGVKDLQRADAEKAAEKFQEVLQIDPNDELARRQHAFAQTYQERPKDLLYRIYVKHLPFR